MSIFMFINISIRLLLSVTYDYSYYYLTQGQILIISREAKMGMISISKSLGKLFRDTVVYLIV